jgi:hypothetical protein
MISSAVLFANAVGHPPSTPTVTRRASTNERPLCLRANAREMLFLASAPTFPSEVRSGGGAPEGCRIWRRRHAHEQCRPRSDEEDGSRIVAGPPPKAPLLVCREVDSPLRCGDQAVSYSSDDKEGSYH